MSEYEESPDEALARNLDRIRTEGLNAATDAAIALLRDPKAPAAAKSATINSMYRASGLYGKADDPSETNLAEMTPTQVAAALRAAERELARSQSAAGQQSTGGGIFD